MSRPLRVAMMASVRWYNASAAYAVELSRALLDHGHQVRLWVQPGSPVETEAAARSIPLSRTLDLTNRGNPWSKTRTLRREFAEFSPDVVNPHRGEDHLFAYLALRRSGVPLVRTRGDVRTPRPHLGNRFMYRRGTTAHIAAAEFMADRFYPPLGVLPERVHVVRPAVDEAFTAGAPTPEEARRRLGLTQGPWVGLIGRFTRAKGHRVLLEAFAGLSGDPPPRLLLSGVPNEISADDLYAAANAAGVADRVEVTGRLSDVREALRALDVLAVPSVASEAIARIAMEALALGVPVVASRLNALTEVVGPAGLLVPPGDAQALHHALSRALADDAWRQRAAVEGPVRMARRYARPAQVERTLAVFREAAGPGAPRPGGTR